MRKDPIRRFNVVPIALWLAALLGLVGLLSLQARVEAAAPGTAQFTAEHYTVNEHAGTASISIDAAGPVSGPNLQVRCDAASGSATVGVDISAGQTVWSWPPGDVSARDCVFAIYQDAQVEGDEQFTARLETLSGELLDVAVVTIVDDDTGSGSVRIMCCSNVEESHPSVSISIVREGSTSGAIGVSWATEPASPTGYDIVAVPGKDYIASSGSVAWADGEGGTKSVYVTLLDDGVWQEDQVFGVRIFSPTGGAQITNPASMTIVIEESISPTFPSVSSIAPSSGPSSGGTRIQIFGNFLDGVTNVTVGGLPCSDMVWIPNRGDLKCTTPAGSPGVVEVMVTTPNGQNKAYRTGNEFTYIESGPPTGTVTPAPTSSSTAPPGTTVPPGPTLVPSTTPTPLPTAPGGGGTVTPTPTPTPTQLKYRLIAALVVFDGR